jgi:hypothetical protein
LVVRERIRKNLDRYLAIELPISCLPHLPHAVFAEQEYLVVTNLVAQRKRSMSMNNVYRRGPENASPG